MTEAQAPQQITITLSPENENEGIKTIEDLLDFIVNELENANIGAYYIIEPTTKKA